MKIVKIERTGPTGAVQTAQGLLTGETVQVVGAWFDGPAERAPFTLSAASMNELKSFRAASTETVLLSAVRFAMPIDPLARILCVGMNYRDHVGEIKLEVAANPTIFTRSLDTLVPHGAEIVRPRVSNHFDFEGEIAIVIGRTTRHATLENALEHVAGYTILMDGSVRDYQKHSLTAGKNFRSSGAAGPWVVPAAAFTVVDPKLETRLNGTVMQSSRASLMIWGIAAIIEYCSRWAELRPGDVIATGTPGGVGSRREPPLWMKPGDRLEVEVEGIGVLANTVIDEA